MRDVRGYLASRKQNAPGCFRSSSSPIGAFSPKTRPGKPSKCEFVMHFDELLV